MRCLINRYGTILVGGKSFSCVLVNPREIHGILGAVPRGQRGERKKSWVILRKCLFYDSDAKD